MPVNSSLRALKVAESRFNMECKLGGSLVLGEVLRIHVNDHVVDGFKIDPVRLRAVDVWADRILHAYRRLIPTDSSQRASGSGNLSDVDEYHPAARGLRKSRVNMECRLTQIIEESRKPMGGSLVLREALRFHVNDELVDGY